MECTKCGFDNPEQARFCGGCGSTIAMLECQYCQAENAPGSRFCNACGQSLAGRGVNKELLSAHAERRILTVLFCDLVDSTVLVDTLDPELSRNIIRDFQTISKRVIEKNGGRITTYLGDGMVALFSHHESNAERAINTALQINRDIEQAGGSFSEAEQPIRVRCGIATGLAVVGDDMLGHSQVRLETAIGLPMNLAARIQSLAMPGGIAIDNASYDATRGLFEFEDTGQHMLKGIQEAQQVWRVIAEKSISSRFVAHAAEVTPMVDRVEILQELKNHWEKCTQGDAQVVLFSGEAGVGKSRIEQELVDIVSIENDYNHLEYQCSPYHTHTSLYPVVNRIKAVAGFEHGDTPADQLEKLEVLVRGSSNNLEHDMPAFVDLMALPQSDVWPAPKLEPEEKKAWLFDTLINNMLALSEVEPLMLTIEDVHWIDPTTLELVNRVADVISGHPVMLLMTSRPEYSEKLLELPGVRTLEVDRLPEKYAQLLLDQVKGEMDLPPELQEEIVQRTDGIPLYIEELSKSLMESLSSEDSVFATSVPGKIVLPGTLQESLLSRLDRLPEGSKSIAQLAAVIGRDFSFDLLETVADYQDKNLYQVLTPLLKAQMVFQRKAPPNAVFSFKHALYRDAAYEAILKSDLTRIHHRIGTVIEQEYPEISRNNPGLLAQHFTEGQDCSNAVKYWLKAGKKAGQRYALVEARSHFLKGLECLDALPEDETQKMVRLEILIGLGPILMALEGSASGITRQNYADAVALCSELPESTGQFTALWGQWLVSKDEQDDHGLVWAEKLQILSEKLNNSELRLQAHHCHWTTYFHLGEFNDAKEHISKGLQLYHYDVHGESAVNYGGHDAKVCGNGFLAHILWFRGDNEQALLKAQGCYDWAIKTRHKGSLFHAIELNLLLQMYRRDQSEISAWYKKLAEVCVELDSPEYKGMLKHCEGQVMSNRGLVEEGAEKMISGFDELSTVTTVEDLPLYGEIIATAYLDAGHYQLGLDYINRIVAIQEAQRVQYWRAEVFRCKGELLMKLEDDKHALECLKLALDTAEMQQAKILQLRAAISLFQFNRKTNLFPVAETNLRRVNGSFEPGTSSPEQRQAEKLLYQIN